MIVSKEKINSFFERNKKVTTVWVNTKGEFFTNENFALNSENGVKSAITKYEKGAILEKGASKVKDLLNEYP